jgi:hypothetical protein
LYIIKTEKSFRGGIDMKGNSDKNPKITVQSNEKTQVRYNILEVTKEDMNREPRISFDFDYIEIEGELTREKIIDGIISNIHSKSNELALINDELASPGTSEYAEYQLLRTKAKEIASEVLESI